MRGHLITTAGVAAVTALAAVVALVAAAVVGDRKCTTFTDADDPSVRHEVCGRVLERYLSDGGPARRGLPVSDERPTTFQPARRFGDREQAFLRGIVYLNSATGETAVGTWFAYTPL